MAYDDLAESIALIEGRPVVPVRTLTRRRRFAAMGVDVAGDLAVTLFARRGVGCTWAETHVLALRNGEWTWLGGSGSSDEKDLLTDRPAVLPRFPSPMPGSHGIMAVNGSGGVLDDGGNDGGPWLPGRWIEHAEVWVNAQVASVKVADRVLSVPWHGRVVVVWSGPGPRVVARDGAGSSLGELLLASTK